MDGQPDAPSPDPAASSRELRLSDSAADRAVTIAAWVAGLGLIAGLAGLAAFGAHLLQRQETRLEVREREYISPPVVLVAPPPSSPDREAPQSGPEPVAVGRDGVVITNPNWISPPRPEFPAEALRAGIERGRVELECQASADGRIHGCEVITETPSGAGFARTSIEAAKAARLKPRTINGEATGGRVRFSTRFSLG